jgi:hypothetical protein
MKIEQPQQETIGKLKSIDFSSLERTEELGRDYSFKDAASILKEIYSDFSNVMENSDSLRLPTDTENQIFNIATRLFKLTEEIKNFVLKGNEGNAPNQHKSIHDQANGLYQENLRTLVPLIERINILKLNPKEVEGQVSKALKSIKEIETIKDEAEKTKSSIDTAIKEVRDALGKEGALISATDFKKQADEHKDLSKKWFYGVIGSLIGTVLLTILIFGGFIPALSISSTQGDYLKIIQVSMFKLVLLSISYLVLYQSLKNYKVNQHLYVLNKHRQLVLSVYPLMAKATNDQEQSNNIVAQASKAIFEQNVTGYLDSDGNPNPINLTEVVTKIIDKKV